MHPYEPRHNAYAARERPEQSRDRLQARSTDATSRRVCSRKTHRLKVHCGVIGEARESRGNSDLRPGSRHVRHEQRPSRNVSCFRVLPASCSRSLLTGSGTSSGQFRVRRVNYGKNKPRVVCSHTRALNVEQSKPQHVYGPPQAIFSGVGQPVWHKFSFAGYKALADACVASRTRPRRRQRSRGARPGSKQPRQGLSGQAMANG
ncbi:uncharacterized protein V1510DRAFT_216637 [Dipodascopsis tothii]|uniref:uncharacterized protein n=1 Tax=Dipodascopsis tothii TaxID=44089 RepID=UPI0034CEACDD